MIKAYSDCEHRGKENIYLDAACLIDTDLPRTHPINADHTACKEPHSHHCMYCMSNLEQDKCPMGFRL